MTDSSSQTSPLDLGPSVPEVPSSRVRLDIGALSDRGRVREANEDAYVVFRIGRYLERVASNVPDIETSLRSEDVGHVLMVADGVGGHQAGEVASRTTVLSAIEFVLRAPKWALKLDDPATREKELRELRQRSRTYLTRAQAVLRGRAASDPGLAGMGTTLTGAYVVGVDLFVLHVGDSRAYLLREGALRKITRDHTLAQEFADAGMISQAETETHRLQHVLTRAVGGPDDALEGDFHHVRVAHGDRLLLCSDGLTDMVSDSDIAGVLASHAGSQDACRALVDLALERGGRDNVTAIVAGFEVGAAPPA